MMNQIIKVNAAEFAIAKEDEILEANGVGSCIVVCLYERFKKIGSMLHFMLPHRENNTLNPLIFADTALPLVLFDLEQIGINKKMLEAHITAALPCLQELKII